MAALLAGTLGAGACVPDGDVPPDVPTWDELERSARRELEGQVSYVVEGDVPVSLADLRAYYDEVVLGSGLGTARSESIVNRVNGQDDVWTADQRRDLTYCVGNDFGTSKTRAVTEMRLAAEAWESVANVRFRYIPAQDASCTGANTAVTFAVRPWTSGGACAFFPSGGGCVARTVVINFADFDNNYGDDAPNLTTVGVLRHELGHVLGLRHEHTRPESGGCFEDSSWRALTPYDPGSVMHYPWCPSGVMTSDMSITARDAEGVRSLYGARSRLGTSGKVALVSRIATHLESLWVAPDGAVQGAWWYQTGGWQRYTLAAAGSAATAGGISLVSRIPTHMEAVWIAPDGSVQGAWWYQGGTWQRYQLAPAGSASTTGGIVITSRTSRSLDVLWTGADGSVQGAWWEEGAPWQRYQLAPASSAALDASPLVISRIPTHMEAFWAGANGSIQGAWWYETTPGQRVWQRYILAGAGSAVTGAGIGGVARTHDRMEVLWIAPSGAVSGARWALGSNWQGYTLAAAGSAVTTGGVATLSRAPDHIEAFWTGASNTVRGAWWYESGGGPWSATYTLSGTGTATANAAFGVATRIGTHLEVQWPGVLGSLEGAAWNQGSPWQRYQVAPSGNVSTSQ